MNPLGSRGDAVMRVGSTALVSLPVKYSAFFDGSILIPLEYKLL